MTDTDKMLQTLQRLEAGQQAIQKDVKVLQDGQQAMQQNIKVLQAGQQELQAGQKALQEDVKVLQGGQKVLQDDVSSLKEGQKTLELKVEAYHEEQKAANVEIITTLHDIISIDTRETDKRLTRMKNTSISPRQNSSAPVRYSRTTYGLIEQSLQAS